MDDEFGLIDAIVAGLGDRGAGDWITVGPGDDAALIQATPGMHQVASIDSLLADVHFPLSAPPQLIGYRALMVAFSDLAAMAATPRYCLVSLSIDAVQLALGSGWSCGPSPRHGRGGGSVRGLCMWRQFESGALNIGVSVHGEVDRQRVLLRSGGAAGHGLYVTGPLGGAAACVRTRQMVPADPKALTPLQQAYYRPLARCDLAADLGLVAAGMDISDGLAQT